MNCEHNDFKTSYKKEPLRSCSEGKRPGAWRPAPSFASNFSELLRII